MTSLFLVSLDVCLLLHTSSRVLRSFTCLALEAGVQWAVFSSQRSSTDRRMGKIQLKMRSRVGGEQRALWSCWEDFFCICKLAISHQSLVRTVLGPPPSGRRDMCWSNCPEWFSMTLFFPVCFLVVTELHLFWFNCKNRVECKIELFSKGCNMCFLFNEFQVIHKIKSCGKAILEWEILTLCYFHCNRILTTYLWGGGGDWDASSGNVNIEFYDVAIRLWSWLLQNKNLARFYFVSFMWHCWIVIIFFNQLPILCLFPYISI